MDQSDYLHDKPCVFLMGPLMAAGKTREEAKEEGLCLVGDCPMRRSITVEDEKTGELKTKEEWCGAGGVVVQMIRPVPGQQQTTIALPTGMQLPPGVMGRG